MQSQDWEAYTTGWHLGGRERKLLVEKHPSLATFPVDGAHEQWDVMSIPFRRGPLCCAPRSWWDPWSPENNEIRQNAGVINDAIYTFPQGVALPPDHSGPDPIGMAHLITQIDLLISAFFNLFEPAVAPPLREFLLDMHPGMEGRNALYCHLGWALKIQVWGLPRPSHVPVEMW